MLEPPAPSTEIEEWLSTLHLSQYILCFQQGGYRVLEDCRDLTDEQLLGLKVFPTGHRRRILRSLEALGVRQHSGEEEEGDVENGRHRKRPVLHPRHIFLKDKKRGTSYQRPQPKGRREGDSEGSQTLPPGAGLGTEIEDVAEGRYLRPPIPTPRNPQNIQTSASQHTCIPASVPPCSSSGSSSSSSESLSISEMPSDWEISSEDPSLSGTDSVPCPAGAPNSALADDHGGFCGEMVENSIYEAPPGLKVAAGPRITRSYRLRHRPVPEIPNQPALPLQDRYSYTVKLEGIVRHCETCTFSLCCRELHKKIDTTLMSVW